jgi:hypothetical protein
MCYYFSKCRRAPCPLFYRHQKTVFKSADESPKLLMSREGSKSFCLLRIFVNKCPRVRYPSISFSTLNFYEVFPKFDHSPRFRQMGWQRFARIPVERFHSSRNLEKNFSNLALRYLGCLSTDRIIVRKTLYVLRLEMKTYP